MLTNPSIYSAKFFSAWEMFADEITAVRHLPAAAGDDLLTIEQNQYAVELIMVAKLLYQLGQPEHAARLQRIAKAFHDHAEGVPNPLFGIGKPRTKAWPHFDPSEVWCMRAELCLGLGFLVAGGTKLEDAVAHAIAQHGTKLKGLGRPGTNLRTSMLSWYSSISTDAAANVFALDTYKIGMKILEYAKSELPAAELRRLGERHIAMVAQQSNCRD